MHNLFYLINGWTNGGTNGGTQSSKNTRETTPIRAGIAKKTGFLQRKHDILI